MANETIANPYAQALLALAIEQGALRPLRDQLAQVVKTVDSSPELETVFANPTIATEERNKVVEVVATRLALSKVMRNFLFVLSERRRLPVLRDIEMVFQRLADAHLGVMRAEAVSSTQLSLAQITRLKNTLSEKTGKTVLVSNTVDPSLLGGLQVKIDGRVYDASVRTRLRNLREAILQDL